MPDTAERLASPTKARERIRSFIEEFEGIERLDKVVENLNAMVAAVDYDDSLLIESHLNDVFEAIAKVATQCISDLMGQAKRIGASLPRFWDMLEDCLPAGILSRNRRSDCFPIRNPSDKSRKAARWVG